MFIGAISIQTRMRLSHISYCPGNLSLNTLLKISNKLIHVSGVQSVHSGFK